ncbi:BCCT family transporter [Deferrisoma camini]|uniref:BCCT family transporter n=1 Tax=Deferrisoma camini TaxID=1035120 RepID=UPI00046D851E|nr:BCCT family transporter [Deferrisoma camini]
MPEPRGSSARPFDPITFGVSAAVTAAFVLWAVVAPTSFSDTINAVFSWTTTQWGWLYLLTAFLLVVASFLLLVTDLGKMRLGRPDDRPEFSNFSWFAMLFGAAIAAGIIFWGPAEPAYHYMTPPPYFGGAAKTPEAAANAMTQSFFHWGLSAWAIYLMLTVPLAHACYTKDLPFRFSSAFYYVLGDRIFGVWGKVLDIFAVFATLGGLATTTGLVALQMKSGIQFAYGFDVGTVGTYAIIGVLTAVFTLAVYTGLEKGVKLLADWRMYATIAVWLFVFLVGPTRYFMDLFTNSLGQYLQNFLGLSLYTEPGAAEKWIGAWTVFYWAWWMSWAPFVAMFIARISKGRTIRQTVAATLILPTLADFLWYAVIGGAGIHWDVTQTIADHGVESAIFAIARHLPLTQVLTVGLVVLVGVFVLTSANSAAMALAMFVSGHETPSRNLRAFWGIALGGVAAVLAGTGSLKAIQTASIATAFPLMFLLLAVIYGTFRGLSRYRREMTTDTVTQRAA